MQRDQQIEQPVAGSEHHLDPQRAQPVQNLLMMVWVPLQVRRGRASRLTLAIALVTQVKIPMDPRLAYAWIDIPVGLAKPFKKAWRPGAAQQRVAAAPGEDVGDPRRDAEASTSAILLHVPENLHVV